MTPKAGALIRSVGAANATALLHATRALLASGIAWAFTSDALAAPLSTPSRTALASAATYVAAQLLFGPWLAMLWLEALTRPRALGELARSALARYGVALGVSVCCIGGMLLAGGAGLALLVLVHAPLSTPNARASDLTALAVAVPLPALALVYLSALHDTARAAIALGASDLGSALRLGRRALSPSLVALSVGAAVLALVIFVLAAFTPALVAQILALAATCLRGLWLATVVERLQRGLAQRRGNETFTAVTTESTVLR